MSFSRRLSEVRNALKLKQKDIAQFLGMTPTAISDYEAGKREPSYNILIKLAERYNISLQWLLTGEGEMFLAEGEKGGRAEGGKGGRQEVIRVTIAGEIAAGPPIEIKEGQAPLGVLDIPGSLLPIHGRYIGFRVHGHSMHPWVQHGDIVVIDQDVDPAVLGGKICAFRIEGGITLKRLIYDTKVETTFLFPINHDEYEPMAFHWDDCDIRIIGVQVLLIRR